MLAVSGGGAPFEVRVNDCPVLREPEGMNLQVTLDVNHWMRSGANVLSLRVDSARGACEALVQRADLDRPRETPASVAMLRAPRTVGADPPVLTRHLTFGAELPMLPWRWDRQKPAEFKPRDRLLCTDEVYALHAALLAGDLAAAGERLELKSEELCQARYIDPDQRQAELRAQLTPLVDPESGWRLEPLDPASLDFGDCASGRMVRASNKQTGASPLLFVNISDGLVAAMEVFLCREGAMQWRIIR